MTRTLFTYILHFIILCLLQLFVLNNIFLFDLIHPMIYFYLIIILPFNTRKNLVLVFAFIIGLVVDVFSNTYGLHTFSTVLIAFIRIYLLSALLQDEITDPFIAPHIWILGAQRFLVMIVIMVFVHHLFLHFMQAYAFRDFWFTLLKIALNTLFSSLMILFYELSFFYNVRKQ